MKRRAPIKRKPGKKRASKTPRCVRQRCGKAQLHDGLCKKHLILACDDMARALKRVDVWTCPRCGTDQNLQWSHHLSRRFMHIRWDPRNATMHCAPCHTYLTHNPFAHVQWITDYIGAETYRDLYVLAYGELDFGVTGIPASQFKSSNLIDWYDRLRKDVA